MAFKPTPPAREVESTKWGGLYTEADPASLPMGASPLCWDIDFGIGEIMTRPGLSNPISAYVYSSTTSAPALPPGDEVMWLKSAELVGPNRETIMQDSLGHIFTENLTTFGTFTLIYSGIINNARAISETIEQHEYICLSDLEQGKDQPRQWDSTNLDRISQVGPGQGPAVPVAAPVLYVIESITEIYASHALNSISWQSNINLYDAQQPSTQLVFLGATGSTDFTTGLQVGDLVYVSNSAPALEGLNQNGTYAVVFTGYYTDGDGTRQYFQVTANQANADFARNTAGGEYRKTQALVQLANPIPQENAVVGGTISISGASISEWNQTWTIVATPTEGQLQISSTSLTAGVATYDYSLISGVAPGWQTAFNYPMASQIVSPAGDVWQISVPGISGLAIPAFAASPQTDGAATWIKLTGVTVPITIFNTSGGNGIFNVQDAVITSADETTFTIALASPDIPASAEQGYAVSGTGSALIIDPGQKTLGTGNPGDNPIYGDATGGTVSIETSVVASGQRYAVCLFKTRNGYITPASPPVSFDTTGDTAFITFNKIPIGPPDVIARIIAFTLANSGIGGAYFYIPDDVIIPGSAASLGETVTVNKTVLDDNTSTSLTIRLRDDVLASSINITAPGNNLLQERELGECVSAVQFSGRAFYLGERVKNDQFVNLTWDGGVVQQGSSGPWLPAGWTVDASLEPYVSIVPSPIVNTSLLIENSGSSTLNPAGPLIGYETLHQTAYETAFNTPIIQPATGYSARITAERGASAAGSIVFELYSSASAIGSPISWDITIPMALLGPSIAEFDAPFGNPLWQPVPQDLQFRVYPIGLEVGASVLVDRIEVYPTEQPVYKTQIAASYILDPEAIDAITGKLDASANVSEPLTNHYRFLDRYFLTTDNRTFAPIQTLAEPSNWEIREVSNAAGSVGPLAADVGPEYVLTASHDGCYIFDGGSHQKIFREIQQLWNLIYPSAKKTIWIKNDITNSRIMIGLPIPTPNRYLPEADFNAQPALPNILLVCSYLGLPTGRDIAAADPITVSMFTGSLLFHDKRRKWTIWQIPAAIAAVINRQDSSKQVWFGQDGSISLLDPNTTDDNGAGIASSYTTFGYGDPLSLERLRLPGGRKLYGYGFANIEGTGQWTLTTIPEQFNSPYASTQPPFTLSDPALDDVNFPINETGNRCYFRIDSDGEPGTVWRLKRLIIAVSEDTKMAVTGR